MSAATASPLLTLPRELRDEISELLLLPAHIYTSTPTPSSHTLHRQVGTEATYLDTRIYLPVRAPSNILATCRQLREECLDLVSRYACKSSATSENAQKGKEHGDMLSQELAVRADLGVEEMFERESDDGSVRITLEVLRETVGLFGYYVPVRKEPSPRFRALGPCWGRVRRLKFLVWAGFDFWKGPSRGRGVGRGTTALRSKLRRKTADQTDAMICSSAEGNAAAYGNENHDIPPLPPNPLSIAIKKLLEHMPNVEELAIDVLIHTHLYWNWDLPDEEGHVQWEGVRPWLDESLSSFSSPPDVISPRRPLRKLTKRLIACQRNIAFEKGVFVSRVETLGHVVTIEERIREVKLDLEGMEETEVLRTEERAV